MTTIARAQLAALMRLKPTYVAPTFQASPYLCPEIYAGDAVDLSAGALNACYPGATLASPVVLLSGAVKGGSYTTQAQDAGKVLTVSQSATNAKGSATSQSSSVTVVAPVTFVGQDLLGGNVEPPTDYTHGRFFNNAAYDGRGWGVQGTHAAGGISLDTNGWPTATCELVLTATPGGGADGQLAPGTYQCSFQSAGQASAVTLGLNTNCSISNIVNQPDGVTTKFSLVIGSAAVCALYFSGGVTNLDVPRDGSSSTSGQPLFTDTAVSYYAQFATLRFMDFLVTNFRADTTWASRPANYVCPLKNSSGPLFSWELVIQFINAVKAWPGSKLKKAWINLPPNIDTTYASNLAALLNSYPVSSGVIVYVELANEPWNGGFAPFSTYMAAATTESQVVATYGVAAPTVTSVVGDGANATVTLSVNLPAFITNGAPAVIAGNGSVASWGAGTLASPTTVTVTGAKTFTYPCTQTGTMSGTGQWGAFFNLASTLVADNTSFSVFDQTHKFYIRKLYALWQAWSASRSQDRFVINMQQYGGIVAGGSNFPPVHFAYAAYINAGSAAWLYGAAIAPYVKSAAGNGTVAAILAQLATNLVTTDQKIRAHVYECKKYGIHALAYEGGPDLQATPTLMIAANVDSGMGAFVTSLLDTWFLNGGEEFHFFTLGPGAFTNAAQGGWAVTQEYADTTSPKITALFSYAGRGRTFTNVFGSPGNLLTSAYQATNGAIQGTTGVCYWSGTGAGRYVDFVAAVPRTRRYQATIWGTDSVAGTHASLYVDGVLIGTSTLPNGGGGNLVGSTASAVPDPLVLTLTSGPHVITVQFGAGVGTAPGVLKVALAAA